MERQLLLEQVHRLKQEGKSIRTIAAQLSVHPSRVQRALKSLGQRTTPLNPRSPLSRSEDGAFVGRQREMAELQAALDGALSGQGRMAMLVGEPGIGKTRTAQELASHAESLGAQVLWGRCYEEQGTPPYWLWVQPIRSYVQKQGRSQLQSEMGSGAADIAEIAPQLRVKLPDLEPAPSQEAEQARFRLFNSITTFFKNAAQSQPLMLVLDDLHWADRSSLLLLEFLVREIQSSPLLVLGTYRDVEVSRHHPLSETLGSLIREQRFHRVQLNGLAEPEVEELIRKTAVARPPPGLSATVHRRTEGNPLFVREIIGMLTRDGLEENQDYLTNIPEGVRDAIRRRLNRLSEGCNQVLAMASVVGREFDFRLLSALMVGFTEAQLLGLVEEALEARVIEEVSAGGERYQFSHALIQETLVGELSAARRVRLHAHIAETLENLYCAEAEAHASELAHHFAEAESVLGTKALVQYALLAGEQALATYSWEEALRHFQRGLAAKEGQPIDAQAADLLFGLGHAQTATLERYRQGEVLSALRPAFDYYKAAGNISKAVAVAEFPFYGSGSPGTEGIELLSEALALVPPDSYEAGRLLARYGAAIHTNSGDYKGARQSLDQALAIARREADLALERRILAMQSGIYFIELRYQDSLECSLQSIRLSPQNNDPRFVRDVSYWNAERALIALGEVENARDYAAAHLKLAEQLRDRFSLAQAFHAHEVLALLRGDWDEAREFSDRGLEVDPRDARLVHNRAVLEYQVGNFAQGDVYLERLIETMQLAPGSLLEREIVPMTIAMAFRITGKSGHLDVAEAAAESVLSTGSFTPLAIAWPRTGLALLAVERGDVAAAEEQYEVLKLWPWAMSPLHRICTTHVLALLAQTMGLSDEAMSHFEEALAFCRKASWKPELSWTCHDYAKALLQRNGPSDHTKATSLLDESLAISTALGMRPLMEKVTARQEKLGLQPAPVQKYPSNLTERQWDVLQLLAQGKTNREIAQALVLSDRTVQRHIADIYDKIGARNRSEATAFALSQVEIPK